MNNEHVLNKINDMLNGDYCFSADELPSLRSDDDTQINISWIDKFKFVLVSERRIVKSVCASYRRRSPILRLCHFSNVKINGQ